MSLHVVPLSEDFTAEVSGVDLRRAIDGVLSTEIEKLMDEYGVLVWRDQRLTDDQHMAFTRPFGPLDVGLLNVTKKPNRFNQDGFVDTANVGFDGKVMPPNHRAVTSSLANQLWHTDSSFLPTVAKYSILCAATVPDTGGNTEFADLRAGHDLLPHDLHSVITGKSGEHHALHSRVLLGNTYTKEQMNALPPTSWPLIHTHPGSQRKLVFASIQNSRISGMSIPESRMVVAELLEHLTQRQFVYTHKWRSGDMVMWDNRCTLHRGRRFDLTARRDLRRTTTRE